MCFLRSTIVPENNIVRAEECSKTHWWFGENSWGGRKIKKLDWRRFVLRWGSYPRQTRAGQRNWKNFTQYGSQCPEDVVWTIPEYVQYECEGWFHFVCVSFVLVESYSETILLLHFSGSTNGIISGSIGANSITAEWKVDLLNYSVIVRVWYVNWSIILTACIRCKYNLTDLYALWNGNEGRRFTITYSCIIVNKQTYSSKVKINIQTLATNCSRRSPKKSRSVARCNVTSQCRICSYSQRIRGTHIGVLT